MDNLGITQLQLCGKAGDATEYIWDASSDSLRDCSPELSSLSLTPSTRETPPEDLSVNDVDEECEGGVRNGNGGCQYTCFPVLPSSSGVVAPDKVLRCQLSQPTGQLITLNDLQITTQTVVYSAWALVAGQMTSSDKICFGGEKVELVAENSHGIAASETTPMHIELSKNQTIDSLLEAVQSQITSVDGERGQQLEPDGRKYATYHEDPHTLIQIRSSEKWVEKTSSVLSSDFMSCDQCDIDDITSISGGRSFALALAMTCDTALIHVEAKYDSRVIETWLLSKILNRLDYVIQQFADTNPGKLVDDIDYLSSADLSQIWRWNGTLPAAVDRCMHQIFQENANLHPFDVAVEAWDGQLTYSELDDLSDRLATHLMSLGIKDNNFVPLCFEKSMWVPVSMLAVLKTGGAFVLLDPSFPEERLGAMVKQVLAKLVLCSATTKKLCSELTNAVVTVDGSFANALKSDLTWPHSCQPSSSAMFAVFTSGSTGTPKGAVLTHTNYASALTHQLAKLGFSKESRIFDFASYAFDVSVHNVFAALTSGARLCIPSDESRHNDITQSMADMRVTIAHLTPSVTRLIDPEAVPTLKTMIFTGEPLPIDDVTRWWKKVDIVNEYGPAECTINSVNCNATTPEAATLIGPIVGACGWVVDPDNHHKLVPVGSVGELLIEGAVVGSGYINDDSRTESCFIASPQWLVQAGRQQRPGGGRMYKTGDLVRYAGGDGNLAYVGRKDVQVKIRGQRVDLGEVEHWVRECVPDANQAVAEVITPQRSDGSTNGSQMLAVYLQRKQVSLSTTADLNKTTNTNEPLGDIEIRPVPHLIQSKLAQRLPSYIVPGVFFWVEKLPTTPTGKMNRKALRERGSSFTLEQLAEARTATQDGACSKRQPETEMERIVRQTWAHVLGLRLSSIGLDDNFFHLGGDSIICMKMVAEGRKLGIKIIVADVFRHPLLHDLSRHCQIALPDCLKELISPFELLEYENAEDLQSSLRNLSEQYRLDPASIQDAFPCTSLQEGLMFLSSKRHGDYMEQSVLELAPGVSVELLRQAWDIATRTLPILRTRIVEDNLHGLLQILVDGPVQWTDLTCGLKEHLDKDRMRPMNLGDALSRLTLIRDKASLTPRWLVWTIHHAIYDGWSIRLIMDAVANAYQGKELQEPPPFQAFIKHVQEQNNEGAANYWQTYFDGVDAVTFPSPVPSASGAVADSVVKHIVPNPKANSASQGGITTSTMIRAAWALVLGRMTNRSDVVFGATLYGRNAAVPRLDVMVAPTIATVPVRVRWARDQPSSDYLLQVQQEAAEMMPYEQTGLQSIARVSDYAKNACQFQTHLVIQPGDNAHGRSVLGQWTSGDQEQWSSTYPLTVEVWPGERHISISAIFDSRVIDEWLVRKLLQRLESVMAQLDVADGAQMRLEDISQLTSFDLGEIWKLNSVVPQTVHRCIQNLLQDQVRIRPDSLAICSWDGELTFRELDTLSSCLAAQLCHVGGGFSEHNLIPICSSKSMWTSVAIFGILKSNAGFILLDPHLPQQRLESVIEQVGPKLLITSPSENHICSELAEITITLSWDTFANAHESLDKGLPPCRPSSIAYAIFTSGSTGTPKGVMISHANLVSALHHQVRAMGHTSETRLFDFASYSFDVAISNLFCMIAVGGCLCIPTEAERSNNPEAAIRRLGVNTLDLTPSTLQLLSHNSVSNVHTLVLGGEQLHAKDVRDWIGKAQIYNAYGPSECTPTSVINCIKKAGEQLGPVPIGKGAGVVTWIVDPDNHNDLLPPGCTGELVLEGPLVGMGYMGPQNAEKMRTVFIDDPTWLLKGSSQASGRRGRLYKTGDLAKYGPDGNLTYVGRKDTQVKLRGQRVELGEVECVLRSHPSVDEAAVVLQPQQSLAAFVTIAASHISSTTQQTSRAVEHEYADSAVQDWEDQFDGEVYASMNSESTCLTVGRDFIGWTSMYDGKEIDKGAMNEWLDDTIVTILNAGTVDHVLEVGTGTGMMLFNLAYQGLQSYVGVEPSNCAVDFTLKAAKSVQGLSDKMMVFKGTALDIFDLKLPVTPRLVVINSVVQYFPSQEYLFDLIKRLVDLDTVETIFLGDVRSHTLHKEFLVARAFHIIGQDGSTAVDELRHIVENLEKVEPELLIDPGFFTSLSERITDIAHVEILPKRMRATNELSSYRYAAVLHVNQKGGRNLKVRQLIDIDWHNFKSSGLDKRSLSHLIRNTSVDSVVAIANIAHSKTSFETDVVKHLEEYANEAPHDDNWLSKIRENSQNTPALCTFDLFQLAEEAGCRVEVSWARQHSQRGALDAIFYKTDSNNSMEESSRRTLFEFPTDHKHQHSFGSEPLRHRVTTQVCEELQNMVATQLPPYMRPQNITILDKMPINRNGKTDRLHLTQLGNRDATRASAARMSSTLPCTAAEVSMHKLWCQILDMEPEEFGIDDGFIQLGGNSLSAMKVVGMARQAGFELNVADMFRHTATSIQSLVQVSFERSLSDKTASGETTVRRLMSDIARHDATIAAAQLNAPVCRPTSKPLLTVALTGASGFIGTQVLRQLLEDGRVGRVIAITRGLTDADAKERTIEAARKAQWWAEPYENAFDVWRGDLQQDRLGLDEHNWQLLNNGSVDVVIHNGASVHFMKSYAALEAANVTSTSQLLCLAASNPNLRLVYVSTARCCDPVEEREVDVATALAASPNGYNETKFVAEALVKRAASRATESRRYSVVSPGLVIGTPTEGVANADDWLWRMAAACIRVGVFNGGESDKWAPISDASIVASTTLGAALDDIPSGGRPVVTQVRGGMTMGQFWALLQSAGYRLSPVKEIECIEAIRADVAAHRDSHPLGALADMMEGLGDTTKEAWAESWKRGPGSQTRLSVALMKNVRFLSAVGFLPKPAGFVEKQAAAPSAFTRTGA